jgi:hypothetical protein
MKTITKRMLVGSAALFIGVIYVWPSLWARDIAIDPAMNAHLAAQRFNRPDDAAYEALHWNVAPDDRIPRGRVDARTTEIGTDTFRATSEYSAQDDSYHQIYDDLTLTRTGQIWKVTRHKRCWTGRGLLAWSTDAPS